MDDLPPIIDALLSPRAYDHPADRIRLIQTHISYVLIAGEFAYKIKKPLDLGFLDYSTIEKRRLMCEAEVRLNRRLCAEAYIGVEPIVRRDGAICVGGAGEVLEYAVKMHRMPDERMMPALLEQGLVTSDDIQRIARTIAAFHRASATEAGIAAFGRVDVIRRNWDENFAQIEPYAGDLLARSTLDTPARIRGRVPAHERHAHQPACGRRARPRLPRRSARRRHRRPRGRFDLRDGLHRVQRPHPLRRRGERHRVPGDGPRLPRPPRTLRRVDRRVPGRVGRRDAAARPAVLQVLSRGGPRQSRGDAEQRAGSPARGARRRSPQGAGVLRSGASPTPEPHRRTCC